MYVTLQMASLTASLTYFFKTDGLADNVFPSEMVAICSLVSRQLQLSKRAITPSGHSEVGSSAEDQEAQVMAERIVDYARMCMHNRKRVSPFERAAAREGMYFRGGVSLEPLLFLMPLTGKWRDIRKSTSELLGLICGACPLTAIASVTVVIAMVHEVM